MKTIKLNVYVLKKKKIKKIVKNKRCYCSCNDTGYALSMTLSLGSGTMSMKWEGSCCESSLSSLKHGCVCKK